MVERDLDEPLVVFEHDNTNEDDRPHIVPADDTSSGPSEPGSTQDAEPEKPSEIETNAKPSHEEFMRMIEEEERALLKKESERDRERGIDRSKDIDDGFGF